LSLGEAPDVGGGDGNGGSEFGRQTRCGFGEFTDWDADGFAVELVEPARVFEETFVSAPADRFEDRAYGGFGFGEARGAAGQEAADICRFEDPDH
jgi:hypothetical protein